MTLCVWAFRWHLRRQLETQMLRTLLAGERLVGDDQWSFWLFFGPVLDAYIFSMATVLWISL